MKRRFFITLGAVLVCAMIGIAAANYDLEQTQTQAVLQKAEGIAKDDPEAEEGTDLSTIEMRDKSNEPVPGQNSSPGYRLGNSGGRLAVFVEGSTKPEMVLDVYLSSLPKVDRLLLEQGIEAASYAELVSMIEDYVS